VIKHRDPLMYTTSLPLIACLLAPLNFFDNGSEDVVLFQAASQCLVICDILKKYSARNSSRRCALYLE